MSGSFRWTEEIHTVFFELCASEVVKGNRVGGTLTKEGWTNVHKELTRQFNVELLRKQMKNHWEKMKRDYQILKKLKFGESGLGWNEMTKTIQAPESWWKNAIQENPNVKAFKNKDLSLMMKYYHTLFDAIVATGNRARKVNTYSSNHLETGEEFTEAVVDDGEEGSGDSDDNIPLPQEQPSLFPSTSLKSGQSSGSKRKRSGAEYICDRIDGMMAAMSSRSTQSTAAQTKAANDEATLNTAYDILNNMELVPLGSELYCFAGQHFLRDKTNRAFFLKAPNDHIRFEQIMYAFKAAGNTFGGP